MGRWEELDKIRTRQSGKSMGEFGENYSYRKQYQHDYHDSSGVKWVEPNITPQGKPIKYDPHVIEPFTVPKKDHEGHKYTTYEDGEKDFIYHKRKAYSSAFCRSMREFFDDNPNLHHLGTSGGVVDTKKLRDKEICLDIGQHWWGIKEPLGEGFVEYKKIYPGLDTSISKWNLHLTCQLMKYEPGDAYWREHCENDGPPSIAKRIIGWMIFLNDIKEGGGTIFTHQNFIAKPREGDLYIWPAAWTHLHKGIVAPREHKYILTGWCSYLID